MACSQRKQQFRHSATFLRPLLDHGNKKDDIHNTQIVQNLAFFSVKGAGILIKPGFIVTFCSVRKLFLAVPNAVCCSSEHRRPDNNLAAKTSKNKSRPFFFFFFLPSKETLQHHTFLPVQTVKPLQAEGLHARS